MFPSYIPSSCLGTFCKQVVTNRQCSYSVTGMTIVSQLPTDYNITKIMHFVQGASSNIKHKVNYKVIGKLQKLGLKKENLDEAVKAAL